MTTTNNLFISKMMAAEPLDLTLFLNQEFFYNELDGLNSGIPTRTTPTITPITPSTLRLLDEEFNLQMEGEGHEKEAFFQPPPMTPITSAPITQANGSIHVSMVDLQSWQGGSTTVAPSELAVSNTTGPGATQCPTPPHSTPSSRSDTPPQTQVPRRNVGGRRPIKEKGISPEEEERRQVRRERNKLAAARCRKRRMDHTNELLQETEGLEDKKMDIQSQIQQLQAQKEELELILAAHAPCCGLSKDRVSISMKPEPISIKPEPGCVPTSECSSLNSNKRIALGSNSRPRPTSLPVSSSPYLNLPSTSAKHQSESRTGPSPAPLISDQAGIPISTPSRGIPFNFASLMEGGTGLTPDSGPLVPSCSSQQRSGLDHATSPDTVHSKRMLSL